MNFDISIIDSLEALEQFVPEWLAFLETQPVGARVYNHPLYLLAHLHNHPDDAKNQQLAIVVVRETEPVTNVRGKIVCIAPLSIRSQQFRLEVSVKHLFPIRVRQMVCPGGSLIFSGTDSTTIFSYFDAVFNTIKRSGIHFDLFRIYGLRNNSPFWDYCTTRLTGKPFHLYNVQAEPQHDLRIHLPDSMETLLAAIDKKHRKNVRRALNYFHESVKEYRLERITERDQVEPFFDTMTMIAVNSWQGKTFGLTDLKTESNLNSYKSLS